MSMEFGGTAPDATSELPEATVFPTDHDTSQKPDGQGFQVVHPLATEEQTEPRLFVPVSFDEISDVVSEDDRSEAQRPVTLITGSDEIWRYYNALDTGDPALAEQQELAGRLGGWPAEEPLAEPLKSEDVDVPAKLPETRPKQWPSPDTTYMAGTGQGNPYNPALGGNDF